MVCENECNMEGRKGHADLMHVCKLNPLFYLCFQYLPATYSSCQTHRGNHEATSGSFGKYWVAVTVNCQENSFSIQYCWLIITRMLDSSYKCPPPKVKIILVTDLGSERNFFPSLGKEFGFFFIPLLLLQKAIFATLKSWTSHLNNLHPLMP